MRRTAQFLGTEPTGEEIAAIFTALSYAIGSRAQAPAPQAPWGLAMRYPELTIEEVRALAGPFRPSPFALRRSTG
ncbi:MAG: hypothetical protein ACYDBO_02715 [Vulcanimicrobiaceae bacterium]